MTIPASTRLIWIAILLAKITCTPAWAEVPQENLIGCWSAAYEYDGLYKSDGSSVPGGRLCSREPTVLTCDNQAYLAVTYCFDRKGDAYGAEAHCWSTKKGPICHGSDGLSGSYRLQGNRMNFFRSPEEGENDDARGFAWSCSFAISGHPDVLEFADCTRAMKTFFRDCDFGQKIEEYRTDKCKLTPQ